jgi:hypothetical protein
MIRIDEIYENTFWPWFHNNIPGRRIFFCDPFGHTDPDHLLNHGRDAHETGYVFFHDQEPIQLESHRLLFETVCERNLDLKEFNGTVVVSELGENAEKVCDRYNWKSAYYFFHGWACLDWFRGYDRTFLFPAPKDRSAPKHTFMSPNRIIGGERDHRTLFLYHLARRGLLHNPVSAPAVCPYEGVSIESVAQRYVNTYPDITQVLSQYGFPRLFQGESDQQMTSCWLSNFTEASNSLVYVPTETVYFGRRTHVTEKTFKAIALGMPWIPVAPRGSLAYMRSYGFETFGSVWDESYDNEPDDFRRLEMITDLLQSLDTKSTAEKARIQQACRPMVEHNWRHFYGGEFETILWQELVAMLESLHD